MLGAESSSSPKTMKSSKSEGKFQENHTLLPEGNHTLLKTTPEGGNHALLKPLPEEEVKILSDNKSKKESPYDHLPNDGTAAAAEEGVARLDNHNADISSGMSSPDASRVKGGSPDSIEDFSNLDYIPRSSPTVQTRSMTPEHAQHLRKLGEMDGPTRASSSLKGRKSPTDRLLSMKANTMNAINLSSLRENGHRHQQSSQSVSSAEGSKEESLYNVPRASIAHDLYQTPRSALQKGNGVVGTSDQSNLSQDTSTYNSPRAVMADQNSEGVYNVPRYSSSNGTADHGGEEVYNVPRSLNSNNTTNGNGVYDTPRNGHSLPHTTPPASPSNAKSAPSQRNNYESIDGEIDTPPASQLKPARSFESLHKFRINTPHRDSSSGHISPPITSTSKQPICEYVDIDLALPPAKNAPLPPLPVLGGPTPIVESVYAEIPDQTIAMNRNNRQNSSGRSSPVSGPTYRSPSHVPSAQTAQEGMAKAQKLAEEEGYELMSAPVMEQLRNKASNARTLDSGHTPSPPYAGAGAGALLQKYNINIHNSSVRTRPFSESGILEDSQNDVSKLGTSIPIETDVLSDEYVIVTAPDPRLKGRSSSQNVPVGVAPTSSRRQLAGDEYEEMGPASRVKFPSSSSSSSDHNSSSQYSTPNPSLWGSQTSVPQPEAFTRKPSPGGRVAPPLQERASSRHDNTTASPTLPPHDLDETSSAGIDLAGMSPADSTGKTMYSSLGASEQSASLSTPSGQGSTVDPDMQQQQQAIHVPLTSKPSLVKIMAGSPLDRANSLDLK